MLGGQCVMQASTSTARRAPGPRKKGDHGHSNVHNNIVGRQQQAKRVRPGFDLVLSSGFLAFANHCGFLAAVDEVGLPVNGIMGTSAGALSGSLYCAGYSPVQVAEILSRTPPIKRLRPCYQPWSGGVLSMEAVVEELARLLPARFEELPRPLGVGVASSSGRHLLLDAGSLPEAVAASAAIPYIFSPVDVPGLGGGPFMDGGVHCRIGLQLWRQRRYSSGPGAAAPPAVVHLIGRSSPFSGNDDTTRLQNAVVVNAPKSGKSFFDLGDFDAEFELARRRALPVLREAMERAQQAEQAQQQQQTQGGEEEEQQWQQPRPSVAL